MMVVMMMVVETRLDDVRRRPDLTRGCPRVGAGRRLGRDDLWREGLVVGDPVAVPELPVLPLGQRAAEAELGAARREGGAAVAPLHLVRPRNRRHVVSTVVTRQFLDLLPDIKYPAAAGAMSPEGRGSAAPLPLARPQQPGGGGAEAGRQHGHQRGDHLWSR